LFVVSRIARFLNNRGLFFIFVPLVFCMTIVFKLGVAGLIKEGRTFGRKIWCLLGHGLSHGVMKSRWEKRFRAGNLINC
jgi:hypothetical protein